MIKLPFALMLGCAIIFSFPQLSAATGKKPDKTTASSPTKKGLHMKNVFENPASAEPLDWAVAAKELLDQEHMRQAAFCFYVFQVRSIPHTKVAKDQTGLPALRASLNQILGPPINGWIGQDPEAWFALAKAAIDFEAGLSQDGLRPAHVDAKQWGELVASSRKEYSEGFLGALGDPKKRSEMVKKRKENGLPVGPLKDKGPDIPANWKLKK